ncbi:glycoside hydrolase family 25 protein [Aureimonas pseudogalii]|uniref:GH25 family lysozyme M1 (1,4-beta-N-acetylmuramidase) n=1 Tax=Aureimonas pseudogalii TaxID=1744844 RepID=A0A7W6EEW8_9HYPH|nr:glycoside hydrolase family 25 protein [Aureimonas pseudogalii]MBB3998127.1 GH25 family lysozyme M1 (1,4-beta-N-acetylmuramidase) [Aureimonas pseudogalii]
MLDTSAACAVALRWFCAFTAAAILLGSPARAEWNQPWKDTDRALVVDAYEFNPINWRELAGDKRIAGFINKASDGLPPAWSCGQLSGDDLNLCKNRWWKYTVTQELYLTRREMAKTLGLKWGAYHLGRPGNPREQADHFVDFAQPEADDLIALDIEDNTSEWMSLADAEIFARQIKVRTGRYPVLYTNGSTADFVARNRETYPLLSRLQLWYARYRENITGVFPEGNWPTYALWQFSSMHNCNARRCPYRVPGARNDIDVNVSPLDVAELKKAWPFDGLVGEAPEPRPDAGELIAEVGRAAKDAIADVGHEVAELVSPAAAVAAPSAAAKPAPIVAQTMASAFGPVGHAPIDPLKLLTETAREERAHRNVAPVLSTVTQGPKVDPTIPGDRTPTQAGMDNRAEGLIDSLAQLKGEMRAVREILSDDFIRRTDGVTSEAEAAPADAPRADVKSRILEMMRDASAAVKGAIPAGMMGPTADERASLSSRQSWTMLANLPASDRRVVKAFNATR